MVDVIELKALESADTWKTAIVKQWFDWTITADLAVWANCDL
jgi:hypothetical protein